MINIYLSPGEELFREVRTISFRKEEYSYVHTGIKDEQGDCWTTTELDEANIFQVYNQYREKHGIPFPDEIAGIRQHYGLSAAKMSQILGFGVNQYRLYEDGEVPSISNARTIIAAKEKKMLLYFLEASKSEMTESEYCRIKRKIDETPGDYETEGNPSEYTGFRTLSKEKISTVVKLIISKIGPTFVTKMNKLLFYIDFIQYKKSGFGITGITYQALPFGPVPQNWGILYSTLSGIVMEEYVYPSGQSGVRLNSLDDSLLELSEGELDTINRVCDLFSSSSAGDISAISHKEEGWKDNQTTREFISYQTAFSLNY